MKLLAAIAPLAIALCATSALAQSDASQARANALYKDAKEHFETGDLPKALELCSEAESIFAHPSITFLKGRILHKMSRLREADVALKTADSPQLPKPLLKPLQDERTAVAEEMKQKGELKVTVQPSGSAMISVDGDTATGSYLKWIAPGKHRIEIAAPGYRPVVRVSDISAGGSAEVKVTLVPLGGSLTIVVPGGLKGIDVQVDGGPVEIPEGARAGDRSPAVPVAIGSHEVVCVGIGGKRFATMAKVEVDASVEVVCEGVGAGGGSGAKALGWGGVAVGAGMFGYGAWALGSFYIVDVNDPRWQEGVSTSNKTWGGAVYSVAGLATGLASYWLFLREPAPAPESTQSRHGVLLSAAAIQ
jgi:hypothetical protein